MVADFRRIQVIFSFEYKSKKIENSPLHLPAGISLELIRFLSKNRENTKPGKFLTISSDFDFGEKSRFPANSNIILIQK